MSQRWARDLKVTKRCFLRSNGSKYNLDRIMVSVHPTWDFTRIPESAAVSILIYLSPRLSHPKISTYIPKFWGGERKSIFQKFLIFSWFTSLDKIFRWIRLHTEHPSLTNPSVSITRGSRKIKSALLLAGVAGMHGWLLSSLCRLLFRFMIHEIYFYCTSKDKTGRFPSIAANYASS